MDRVYTHNNKGVTIKLPKKLTNHVLIGVLAGAITLIDIYNKIKDGDLYGIEGVKFYTIVLVIYMIYILICNGINWAIDRAIYINKLEIIDGGVRITTGLFRFNMDIDIIYIEQAILEEDMEVIKKVSSVNIPVRLIMTKGDKTLKIIVDKSEIIKLK